jgi:hypothetical protein
MTLLQVSDDLYLASASVPRDKKAEKLVPQPTNHIVVIDCSGSMWDDLPLIRTQLKDKLPKLLAEGDTITIIWFSGRGEFGTLIKGEPVATLKDLSDLNKAIDRWLRPVCLTGFKEPLEEAARVADELGGVCSLFFMSDGYDNQSGSNQNIIQAVRALAPQCASTTFVEYGYYCNHPLMVSMAEEAGGALIFNEDFKRYEPNFEAAMQKRPLGAKRIEVAVEGEPLLDFAYALDDGALVSFKVEDSTVRVPEHIEEVYYLTRDAFTRVLGHVSELDEPDCVYAAIALTAQRVESDLVFPLLKATGDVRFINLFAGCFGKQKYAEFVEEATKAVFDGSLRMTEGYDPDAVPDENAFTVLDLLRTLSADDGNYLLLDSPDFRYNRTGRAREQVVELPEDVQEKVDALDPEEDAKEIEKLTAPYQPLKFKADPMPNGVPIGNLVFNETRPNVSVQTRRTGKVNLKARKNGQFKKVPDQFETFIYRNYSIVRDGIINVDRLPVRITKGTLQALESAGMPEAVIQAPEGETRDQTLQRVKKAAKGREVNVVLDLRAIPVINRAMVKKLSAEELFKTQYELQKARAVQKVFNSLMKELDDGGRKSDGFKALYGEEAAAWLKEQGITDYSGFGPKGKQAEATDTYVGKELAVKLKGLASIPSLNDFKKRVAAGKSLTAAQTLMKPAVDAFQAFLDSDTYKGSKDQEALAKTWLETELTAVKEEVRAKLYEAAQARFSVVVGQTWFEEFSSLDENTLDIEVEGQTVKGTVEMKEIQVAI